MGALTILMTTLAATTFMFCGVNKGYQGDLVIITDPQAAVQIVRTKIDEQNDGLRYEIYPGKVTYQREYGCPNGGEVIAVIISSGDLKLLKKTGQHLKNSLFQTSLSIATYNSDSKCAKHLTRGFMATVKNCSIDIIAAEWHNQAEKNMSSTMYVTAGFYTRGSDNIVFVQSEANPEKSYLNSKEKIKEWEQMAKLVAQETAKNLGVDIQLKFQDVYFDYLRT